MNPTPVFKQCPQCQHAASMEAPTCLHCGHQFKTQFANPLNQTQLIYGQSQHPAIKDAASKKLAAGLCAILISGLAIHKFILGYTTTAIIQIVLTFVTCGLFGIVGIIEGIIYLTKSDEEFYHTYIANKKDWF
jgi:TM2 domain-containing membrane protein YozV